MHESRKQPEIQRQSQSQNEPEDSLVSVRSFAASASPTGHRDFRIIARSSMPTIVVDAVAVDCVIASDVPGQIATLLRVVHLQR